MSNHSSRITLSPHKRLFTIRTRGSCKEGQSAEAAAETAAEQSTNSVDHHQYNEGEKIWNWMTTVVTSISIIPEIIIEPKHPHTTHNDPDKQENRQKTLNAATTALYGIR